MPRKKLFGLLALALLLAVLVSVPLAAMALADSPESEDPLDLYDENDDGVIDGDEFFSAVLDHLDGRIDRALASRVWQLWRGERASGAQSAKPTSSTTRVLNPSGYLEGECSAYDANDDNVISRDEAFDATDDYFAEGSTMTLEEVEQVVDCYDGDPPPPPVPGIPDEPTLTAENDEDVTATWRAVTHATSYRVRIKVKTDTGWLYTTSVREPTREFGGLASGTYHVQVMACNPAWCGGWSPSGEVPVGPPYFKEGDSADREVLENTAAGVPIGKAVMATDPNGDALTYSLSDTDTDAGSFTIDRSSGQVRTSAALDYETKSTYTVTAQVTDGKDRDGNTEQNPAIDDTITVTINVTDVNDEPTFPSTSTTRSVRENTPSGRNIGAPVAATDDDGDPLTYTLGGTDAGSFSIVPTTGQLRTSAALTKNSYTVTVSVRDSKDTAGNADTATDDTITVTINVTDVNDEPTFPSTSTTRSVRENTPSGRNIGAPVAATDDDGDPLTYTLGGTDAGSFSIVPTTGQLRTSAALTKNSYTVTVSVRDSKDTAGNADTATDDTITVTINVTDVNDEPTFPSTSTTRSVRENTPSGRNIGAPVAATDDDGDPLTYTLGGTDAGSFSIVPTTGQLRTSAALTKNSYTVTVSVRDSKDTAGNADTATDDTITVTINVTDEDDPGTVSLSTTEPDVGTTIEATLTDQDDGVTDESWQWQRSPDSTPGSWRDISDDATESSYTAAIADLGEQLRATVSYTDAHGPDKSAESEATSRVTSTPVPPLPVTPPPVTPAKLAKPDEFSLNPLAHEKSEIREARLSWTGDERASEYVVQLRASDEEDWTSAHSVTVKEAFLNIDLDEILPGKKGLADDPYEYELQVMATYEGDTYEDSGYSKTVTITNSPIIAVDGDSGNTYDENGNPTGKATITWQAITDSQGDEIATGYQIRWVKLPGDIVGPVADDAWSPAPEEDWTLVQFEHDRWEGTRKRLELHQIYAIQLNYTTEAGPGFSAQEFYVWPSATPAGNQQKVATFPMRNYVPTRTYAYYICEGSFPDDAERSNGWTELINDALGRWQTSTDGLVKMVPMPLDESAEESGACYDFRDSFDQIYPKAVNLFGNLTPENRPALRTYVEGVLSEMQNIGMKQRGESMVNEIWMIDEEQGEGAENTFREVSRLVARGACGLGALACVRPTAILEDGMIVPFPEIIDDEEFDVSTDPFLSIDELARSDVTVTSDILINRSRFERKSEDDDEYIYELNIIAPGVRFDTCKGTGKAYDAYRTLVHESGHALGISGHASTKLWYTAMKFKSDVIACTPFPLDVMAIYALYQTRQ